MLTNGYELGTARMLFQTSPIIAIASTANSKTPSVASRACRVRPETISQSTGMIAAIQRMKPRNRISTRPNVVTTVGSACMPKFLPGTRRRHHSGIIIRPKKVMTMPMTTGRFVRHGLLSIPHPVSAINTSNTAWAINA